MSLPQWEDYWKTGWVVSCPTGPMSSYTGALRSLWERFFENLADRARLLDVGTGNGALPLIALEVARRRAVTIEILGIDLARIDPVAQVPDGARLFDGVSFHGGVAAENLPFDAARFDAVCGQFALEYTQRAVALREIHRVLAPGSAACFVLHHASSIVARNARESLQHAQELEQRAGAFADLRDYVAAERSDPSQAAGIHARMTQRMQHLHRLASRSTGSTLLAGVLPALARLFELRRTLSPDDFETAFAGAYLAFKAAERRLADLVAAAIDQTGIEAVAEEARAAGFVGIRHAPVWENEATLVGWALEMQAGK
jgi:ubiquinone/menaquinone biosynthesis C-methylase UbiE